MRAFLLGLAVVAVGCGGAVVWDEPEPESDELQLPDCPELGDPEACAAREPGWVHAVPECLEFGGYLVNGCAWHEGACVRGPYTWSRNKCATE